MDRRLDRLAKAMGAGQPERGQVAFVDLPRWPADAREAFLRAEDAGDHGAADRLVEEQTGIKPTYGSGYVNMVITMPAGTVGSDLAVMKTRSVR